MKSLRKRLLRQQNLKIKHFKNKKKKNEELNIIYQKNLKAYSAIFRDSRRKENAVVYIRPDKVCIKFESGINAIGENFGALAFPGETEIFGTIDFDLSKSNFLTQYSLQWYMPLKLCEISENESGTVKNLKDMTIRVSVEVTGDKSAETENQMFQISLINPTTKSLLFTSPVHSSFNQCIIALKEKLPKKFTIHACWMCAWSNYSPYVVTTFGGLACFKGNEKMKNLTNVGHLVANFDKNLCQVQEMHLCESWEKRNVPHLKPEKGQVPINKNWTFEMEEF